MLKIAAGTAGPWRRRVIGFAAIVTVVIVWYAASGVGLINGGRFPTPTDTWGAAVQISTPPGYAGGTLSQHILHSLKLVLLGFLVAIATGVPLGLFMGASR